MKRLLLSLCIFVMAFVLMGVRVFRPTSRIGPYHSVIQRMNSNDANCVRLMGSISAAGTCTNPLNRLFLKDVYLNEIVIAWDEAHDNDYGCDLEIRYEAGWFGTSLSSPTTQTNVLTGTGGQAANTVITYPMNLDIDNTGMTFQFRIQDNDTQCVATSGCTCQPTSGNQEAQIIFR